ncbi:MAG TPA: TIM barrel protein [Rhizomicrobium sp.]|nr:TIM barrel protein [Rhizomicrobium sp.]
MSGTNRRHALGAVAGLAGLAASPAAKAAQRGKPRPTAESLSDYAVNLDTWFRQVPFEQRFALAKQHNFKFIEFWPADRSNGTKAAAIRDLCNANGLTVVQFAPAWPNFADPAKLPDLLKTTEAAIADARTLGCTQFTVTGHSLIEGMSREAQLAGYQAGLTRMAPMLEAAGMTALVEPFNRVNHLNHLLNGSQPGLPMMRAINSPCVKLLWDFYHMQLEDGDLIEKFTSGIDQVAYVQIGDVPGRHQPGTGEVNHANLLKAVRAAGYRGKIGLEFMPLDRDDAKAVQAMLDLSVS